MKITFFVLSIVLLNRYYPRPKLLNKKLQKSVSVLKHAIEDVVKRN